MKRKTEKKEKRGKGLRRLRWGAVLPTLLLLALGVLLTFVKADSKQLLAITAGCLFALSGIFMLALAFLERGGIVGIVFGIAELALAIALFVDTGNTLPVLIAILACFLALRGIVGLWNALSPKNKTGVWWKVQLIGAIVVIVFPVVLIFDPFDSIDLCITLLGVLMLADGVLEFLSMLRAPFVKRAEEKQEAAKESEKERKKREEDIPDE